MGGHTHALFPFPYSGTHGWEAMPPPPPVSAHRNRPPWSAWRYVHLRSSRWCFFQRKRNKPDRRNCPLAYPSHLCFQKWMAVSYTPPKNGQNEGTSAFKVPVKNLFHNYISTPYILNKLSKKCMILLLGCCPGKNSYPPNLNTLYP